MPRLIAPFLIALMVSCSPATETAPPSFDPESLVSDGGPMGEDIRKVMASESGNIINQLPDEITTRFLNPSDSTYYDITYNASDDHLLYAVELKIQPRTATKGWALHEQFIEYYSIQFGQPDTLEGKLQWITTTPRNTKLEIALSNAGLNRRKPHLTLTYFDRQP